MAGIYLHIPFCKQACHYCDFHFSTEGGASRELSQAMANELVFQKGYLDEQVTTIYLGGGTPSLLKKEELDILFTSINTHYPVVPTPEITLEANPDDLTKEKLKALYARGINRLSIGIQSFDDGLLRLLNRSHDASTARRCLDDARESGFNNISLDLIYAIPGLSERMWQETLAEALRFSPEHISSYALTVEEKTVFGNWSKRGKFHAVADERAARQFEMLMDILPDAGFEHYEISNFCKPGFYSKHNSGYWKGANYLGIGPSAHSYNGGSRQFNIRNNARYIRAITEGVVPFESEILSPENKINEFILTTLRTQWGCDLSFLKTELNDDLAERCGKYILQQQELGLLSIEAGILRLTRKGKLFADKIAVDLMVSG